MSETKALLQRIASLRTRLHDATPAEEPRRDEAEIDERVRLGAWHNHLLDGSLRPLDSTGATSPTLPERLTARAARLVRKGRELLRTLRDQADDAVLQADDQAPLAVLHHESAALVEVVLRAVQTLPASPSAQIRQCEGLEVALDLAEEQIAVLQAALNHRRREEARIDYLAEILRRLAVGQPVGLDPLQGLADQLLDEARAGGPLRFLTAPSSDPARFAAAHGITTAAVLARIIGADPEWQTRLQTAITAALVHDVGMARVPAEALAQPGLLRDDQRRLVERHAALGGPLVTPLWPAGGWPVEAVTDHHERDDGTGYPLGKKEIQIAPFVRLLAVCDVYAALVCARPHRPALDTRAALTDVLLMGERGHLAREYAERLLALSFYPPGTIIELNDEALAVVLSVHPGARGLAQPTRPVVLMLSDALARPLAVPAVLDLAEQQDRHITRNLNRSERRQALVKKFPQLI